ncbi:MAG: DUF1566 domain-containing protein [Candidatus Nanopelagicaceae bacterium]|nr:DUF1566 domain-containing protein [Candidatus Nanopelagicaceae bacterium]
MKRLAVLFAGVLFSSGLVNVVGFTDSIATADITSITTCTKVKTGVNRLLLNGSCSKATEKKVTWKSASSSSLPGVITTCENIKTGKNRLLIKGVCVKKTERTLYWVSTASASPNPTVATLTYKVGDAGPGGGLIFFVDVKNEYQNFDYLEVAPTDVKEKVIWCSDSSHSITSNSGKAETAIGRGSTNTTVMLASCTSGAANSAREYSSGGKSDWFLPSRDELMLVFATLHGRSSFEESDYWSSTENAATYAVTVNFGSGNWFSLDKSFTRYVRAVRAFSESSSPSPSPSTTAPPTFLYKIGDTGPGGGLIYFIDVKNEYPAFTYLEAALSDISGTFNWCNDTAHSIPALATADARAVGRGSANTIEMLAACSSGAANAAHSYSNNGKGDWFLPSIDELKLMYDNLRGSGGFAVIGFAVGEHWSSSEAYDSGAMVQNFDDKYMSSTGGSLKSALLFVRPVRAF